MEKLYDEIKGCARCELSASRTNAVPGVGPVPTDIMFIGEGPGFHEDRQGVPFVGAAGKFLDELLASVGIERKDVYIANVVKCRPPNNRDPRPEEIEACRPYLERQIELLRPKIIVTLGRHSMSRYFPRASISRIHGQTKRLGGITYIPMFHPAAALHQPKYRSLIEEDFQKLPTLLENLVGQERPPQSEQPQQLSLF
jgi:DNA polymerase